MIKYLKIFEYLIFNIYIFFLTAQLKKLSRFKKERSKQFYALIVNLRYENLNYLRIAKGYNLLFSCIFVNPCDIIFIFFFIFRSVACSAKPCLHFSLRGKNGGGAQFRKADFNSVSFYTEKEISSAALFEGRTATWDYENRVDGAENTCENPKS